MNIKKNRHGILKKISNFKQGKFILSLPLNNVKQLIQRFETVLQEFKLNLKRDFLHAKIIAESTSAKLVKRFPQYNAHSQDSFSRRLKMQSNIIELKNSCINVLKERYDYMLQNFSDVSVEVKSIYNSQQLTHQITS